MLNRTAARMAAPATEHHTCPCRVCNGNAILAPVGLIVGTPKQRRELTHSYVSNAHSPSPLGRILSERAGVVKA